MRIKPLMITLMTLLSTGAQSANPPSTPPTRIVGNQLISAVAWKQTAAEYRALYYQGYNMAKMQLDLALQRHKDGDKPLAIISDLDDTILLPLPYWGYLINQHKDFFDDPIWDAWIPKNMMVVAPGALAFFNYAASKGVEVFYVSARDQGDKTQALGVAQVKLAGLPFADDQHVTLLRESSNKQPRQDEIAEKYNVVLYLGDNLNDFRRKYYSNNVDERFALMEQDKDFYGSRYILFPNPTDGHWLRAIFGESEVPANDENRQKLKAAAVRLTWDGK